jgi:hypothetical protein
MLGPSERKTGIMTKHGAGTIISASFEGNALVCPGCGSVNMHHDKVEVFERRHEDSPEGFHVAVDCDAASATVDSAIVGNPSERRGGISVTFWCEQCDAKSRLDIAQDKGRTLVTLKVERAG